MNILGIDLGSSTIKLIEYKNGKIISKGIFESRNYEEVVENFINKNNIKEIDKIVATGINAKKLKLSKYNLPIEVIEEFIAIGTGGLFLSKKEKAIIYDQRGDCTRVCFSQPLSQRPTRFSDRRVANNVDLS